MSFRDKVDKVLESLLVFTLGILVIDVLWQVLSRYMLSAPSKFTDELAGFLLMWVTLLGAAYATGKRQHLALGLMKSKLSGDNLKRIELSIHVITTIFAVGVMIIGGSWLIITRFYLGQISAVLQVPIGYVYMVLPISGIFIIYYSIANAFEDWNKKQLYKSL